MKLHTITRVKPFGADQPRLFMVFDDADASVDLAPLVAQGGVLENHGRNIKYRVRRIAPRRARPLGGRQGSNEIGNASSLKSAENSYRIEKSQKKG
jgi:hypothetical protein